MAKSQTKRSSRSKSVSSKSGKSSNVDSFNVIHFLLHLLNVVKIYHWKTLSYPTHKATDGLYEELNGTIDQIFSHEGELIQSGNVIASIIPNNN